MSVAICFLKNGEKICFQKNKQLRQIFGCGLIKKWNRKEFLQIQIAALLKAVFYISKILWVFLEHWKIIRIKSSILFEMMLLHRKTLAACNWFRILILKTLYRGLYRQNYFGVFWIFYPFFARNCTTFWMGCIGPSPLLWQPALRIIMNLRAPWKLCQSGNFYELSYSLEFKKWHADLNLICLTKFVKILEADSKNKWHSPWTRMLWPCIMHFSCIIFAKNNCRHYMSL